MYPAGNRVPTTGAGFWRAKHSVYSSGGKRVEGPQAVVVQRARRLPEPAPSAGTPGHEGPWPGGMRGRDGYAPANQPTTVVPVSAVMPSLRVPR